LLFGPALRSLGRDQQISKFVDMLVLHFTADGKATQVVVEVGQ